jgi:hypothetical protein
MSIPVAYGSYANIPRAIQSGAIPAGTLILTKNPKKICFYSSQKELIEFVSEEDLGGACVQEYETHYEFPSVGDSEHLYLATAENDGAGYLYRYDATDRKYYKPFDAGEDFDSISCIYGGDAFDD